MWTVSGELLQGQEGCRDFWAFWMFWVFLFSFCKTTRGEIEEKSLTNSIVFVEIGPRHCLDYKWVSWVHKGVFIVDSLFPLISQHMPNGFSCEKLVFWTNLAEPEQHSSKVAQRSCFSSPRLAGRHQDSMQLVMVVCLYQTFTLSLKSNIL